MSKVIRFHAHGGPEVLRTGDIETPPPAQGEVQIRIRAIGLNRADILMRQGKYIERPLLPCGLGLEAAGSVERLGKGVADLSVGDAVSLIPAISMSQWPTYAQLANFPASAAVKHPSSLSFKAAAALWMAYLTAWGALVEVAQLQRGEVVVITAASSSVGLAAIQVANRLGATPIAVTRHTSKRAPLLEAGAASVVVLSEGDLEARLRALSVAQGGARVVLDAVGGDAFNALTAVMSGGGILIEYGGLSDTPTPFPLFNVLSRSLTLRGYLVHEVVRDLARLEAAKAFILDGLATGDFVPVIARTFPFDEMAAAHRFLESNDQFGKIVVTL